MAMSSIILIWKPQAFFITQIRQGGTMNIYLAKKNGQVIYHTDLAAMAQLDGVAKADKTVTAAEWEAAGSTAHIDASGNIVLGEKPDVKARRDEIETLALEERTLQSELDGKDYKVIKASEAGKVLAETDPALHERRDWCRNRINEVRGRLAELNA
jgi:exosome complex RNA-binding protein Csl4